MNELVDELEDRNMGYLSEAADRFMDRYMGQHMDSYMGQLLATHKRVLEESELSVNKKQHKVRGRCQAAQQWNKRCCDETPIIHTQVEEVLLTNEPFYIQLWTRCTKPPGETSPITGANRSVVVVGCPVSSKGSSLLRPLGETGAKADLSKATSTELSSLYHYNKSSFYGILCEDYSPVTNVHQLPLSSLL